MRCLGLPRMVWRLKNLNPYHTRPLVHPLVIKEVPVEGHAHIRGDREHCGKVIRVKPAQEMQVHCEAGVMRLVLHKRVPEGRETVDDTLWTLRQLKGE